MAFAAARSLGFDHVETDAHVTADGVAVALHDPSLDRTTDAIGLVAHLPWSKVRKARIGGTEPVPLLEDLLGTWTDLAVNIDVKADGAEAAVAAAVERTRSHDRVLLTSFSTRRRLRTTALLSRLVATSPGRAEITAFVVASRLPDVLALPAARRALSKVSCLQAPERSEGAGISVINTRTIALAHRIFRPVHVWTVDEPAEMERLFGMGVDGLVTNRADLLREVMHNHNLWDVQTGLG